jgi:hypothetical protein
MIATARPAVVRVSGSTRLGELANCPAAIASTTERTLALNTRPGTASKATSASLPASYPLQSILVERRPQLLIALSGIDKQHGSSALRISLTIFGHVEGELRASTVVGMAYIPGRKETCVTKPGPAARVVV